MDAETRAEFQKFGEKLEQGFKEIKEELKGRVENVIEAINFQADRVDVLEAKVDDLTQRTIHIENNMVTKDYLDRKLATFAQTNNLKVREEGPEYDA